jgi:ribosome-associated heat shock protein Hsp15
LVTNLGTNAGDTSSDVRLDKWLVAARFVKTRGLAQKAIEGGKAKVNDERVKTSRALRVGDLVWLDIATVVRVVEVIGLSDVRRDATFAQTLYRETMESIKKREDLAAKRKLFTEPSAFIEQGRPTKRDRRKLENFRLGD